MQKPKHEHKVAAGAVALLVILAKLGLHDHANLLAFVAVLVVMTRPWELWTGGGK